MRRLLASGPFSAVLLGLAMATAAAQEIPVVTEEGVIKGTMDIDFKSRTNLDSTGKLKEGSPALGAKDIYNLKMTVATTTEYVGKIERQPQLLSSIILQEKQPAQLFFNLNLAVRNPKNPNERKDVGKWTGTAPINPKTGVYSLAGTSDSAVRVQVNAIGAQPAYTDKFGGKLVGKSKQEEGLASYTYKRLIGNKTVEMKVTKVDPMKFEDLELAKGPSTNYPHTLVNGRLDYDYETGNWLTDGVTFSYNYNGKDVKDVMTGSIKWVEDENRKSNGKGYYEFNLRFNEEKNKDATTEADAFAKLSDEDAFFAVDDSIPCLTGKVSYEDKFISGGGDEPLPASSKVTYDLKANKITKVQAVNFFKLWLIGIGPINDE